MEQEIFKKFPWFREFSKSEIYDGESYVEISVPSPGNPENILCITMQEGEVIVYFASWHKHYSEDYGLDCTSILKDLGDIFSENLVVANYICEENLPIKAGVFASNIYKTVDRPLQNFEYFYVTEIRHVSWLGTYNCQFKAAYNCKNDTAP